MPANRKAALTAGLTAGVTALVTLLGALDSDTAKAAVVGVALVCVTTIAIVFLLGSQKHEARVARAATVTEALAAGGPSSGTAGARVTTSTGPKPGGGATALSSVPGKAKR